jgi:hypothetical protein
MNQKIITLKKTLIKLGFDSYAKKESLEIDGYKKLFKYMNDNNINLNIDFPKGSMKGFGSKKRALPFDYGEIVGVINPADGMGWDIILPPSHDISDGKYSPVGIIRVKNDKSLWMKNLNKKPPVGNDKVIISADGKISNKDKEKINKFFDGMWQFEEIEWFA